MATERQIEANRRNATKSTGPKSASGKKRSSQNAYLHGLSLRISSVDLEERIETLAQKIAGDAHDASASELSKIAAESHLQVEKVRHLKKAMTERIMEHGSSILYDYLGSKKERRQWFKANMDWISGRGPMPPWPVAIDSSKNIPKEEPYRIAEAVRPVPPEFVRLQRYENRAAGRRYNAIRKKARKEGTMSRICTLETNSRKMSRIHAGVVQEGHESISVLLAVAHSVGLKNLLRF
jgi:hypothetical protein